MTTSVSRWPDRLFALQRARTAVVLASAGTLAWSGAHWLSLRLVDPHGHLHEHGVGHTGATDGQQQLEALHAYLGPTALLSLLVLAAALVGLRARPVSAGRALSAGPIVLTAGASAAVFALVETVEHAVASSSGPPAALLAVGMVVHALAGAAAAVLSTVALSPVGHRPQKAVACDRSVGAPMRDGAARPLPRVLLAVLAGRAPPVCTATPQPSS